MSVLALAKGGFTSPDSDAKAWAKEHALELAAGIVDTTRDAVRALILESLDGGMDADALADAIAGLIGDESGHRAETIARTEAMAAANAGKRAAWRKLVEDGTLDGNEAQMWVTAKDERRCPQCGELDGKTAALGGTFPGGILGPPAHPNCRCTVALG